MPNSEPTKVRISPKAISTELSITPVGGTIKPAMSNPAPSTISRDIQLMASGNSAESAMDCHRRVRGVIAEQIFDSHGCKVGKND